MEAPTVVLAETEADRACLLPVLDGEEAHVVGTAKFGAGVEFVKERTAHADRDHLPERVEAGALVVIDGHGARHVGEVADGLEKAVAAAESQKVFALRVGDADAGPVRAAVLARNPKVQPLDADSDLAEARRLGGRSDPAVDDALQHALLNRVRAIVLDANAEVRIGGSIIVYTSDIFPILGLRALY